MKNPTAAFCLATICVMAVVMPAAEADKLTRLRGDRSPSELADDERKLSNSSKSSSGKGKGKMVGKMVGKKNGEGGDGGGGVPDRDYL
jgi:hypothetical protein